MKHVLQEKRPSVSERIKKNLKLIPYAVQLKQYCMQSRFVSALKQVCHDLRFRMANTRLFFYFYFKKVNYSQPLYGMTVMRNHPAESALQQSADAIWHAMKTFGYGGHLLDVNCGLGYFSHYFAARGYAVDGIDSQPHHVAICNIIKNYHHSIAHFAVQALNADYIAHLTAGQYGVALLHHFLLNALSTHGLEQTQGLLTQLLEKIPVIFFELDSTENPSALFATCRAVTIQKISTTSGQTLYQVCAHEHYLCGEYRQVYTQKFSAYDGAAYFGRHYYDCGTTFVKKYLLSPCTDNVNQILHEINNYRRLPHNDFFPQLIAERHEATFIEVLFSKLSGANLHDLFMQGQRVQPLPVFRDVLQALIFLRQQGLYHNDVRLWNMMFDGEKTSLFDLGLARDVEHDNTCLALQWLIYQLHDFSCRIHPYPLAMAPDFQQITLSEPFFTWVRLLQQSHSFDAFLALKPPLLQEKNLPALPTE